MLRICMVTPFFPSSKGDMQGISVRVLTEGLVRRGQSVSVLTASKVLSNKYGRTISIYQLPKIPQGTERFILTGFYAFYKTLCLTEDIIHYHWAVLSPNFLGATANELRAEKKPSIVTVRGGDLRSVLRNPMWFSLIKKMLKEVDRVVAISQGMYDLARMYDVPPKKLTIIPNGIDTTLFSPTVNGLSIKKRFGIGNSPLVVSVGLEKLKGMEHLIRAIPKVLSEISDSKFILIGVAGKRKIELQRLVRKLNVDKAAFFVCPAPYHMMPKFFAASDVVATLFYEGPYIMPAEFGRVHLEAMACGKPVITSVAKGLIENGRTGFRVTTNNDQIASTITQVLQDKRLAKSIGENARKLILRQYSAEVTTERYLQLYKEVVIQSKSL